MSLDLILIAGMEEVEKLPGTVRTRESRGTVAEELPPLGMARGGVLLPANRGVERGADTVVVERGNLFAEQVAPTERGVLASGLRRVITHAVVALGREGDAVDVGIGQGAGEGIGVELARHVGDERGGVEVQMDLPLVALKNICGGGNHVHKHETGE